MAPALRESRPAARRVWEILGIGSFLVGSVVWGDAVRMLLG
jgi:hypothetical protein